MKKSIELLIHVLLWALLYFTFWYILRLIPGYPGIPEYDPLADVSLYAWNVLIIISLAIPFYTGYFVTPFLFYHKKKKLFITLTILFGIFYPVATSIMDDGFIPGVFLQTLFSLAFLNAFLVLGISFRSFLAFIEQKRIQEQLEKQSLKSELDLLRVQLNPHFLFNTLNNIDTLIKVNQDKASQSLIKLSDIMRYMLHDCQSDSVPLEKEIEYIRNYVSLEKLRLKNPDFLNFSINGEKSEKRIAPMLFIPFIENAFKHSIDTNRENGIIIQLNVDKNHINFICENLYDHQVSEKDKTPGIGLTTIKKRLELLYPGKHLLNIDDDGIKYKVKLEIQINDN
jgi:two-component system LytT family sensor kinase